MSNTKKNELELIDLRKKKKKKKIVTTSVSKSNGFDNTVEICGTVKEKVIADGCVFVGHGFDNFLSQNSTHNRSPWTKFAKYHPKNKFTLILNNITH
jgi:hypothetical protein